MNTTGVLIYDNTGRVWDVFVNLETVPAGLQGIVTQIPPNYRSVYVNVATQTPVWTIAPDTEGEVNNLQDTSIDHETRISAIEEALGLGGNE